MKVAMKVSNFNWWLISSGGGSDGKETREYN